MGRANKSKLVLRVFRFRTSFRLSETERLKEAERKLEETRRNQESDLNNEFETISAQIIDNFEENCCAGKNSGIPNCDGFNSVPSNSPMEIDLDPHEPFGKLKKELRIWILESNIPEVAVDRLLKILKGPIPSLPSCYKPFLKTNVVFDIKNYPDGSQFVYFGLEKGLRRCINPDLHCNGDILPLQIFVDGLSSYHYCNMQLWPLLIRIYHEPEDVYSPFSIACHCGSGKPKNFAPFFKQFIAEYNQLCRTGMPMGDKTFLIKIQCVIGDKPARSEALCIKGHGSKHACERCDLVAIYFKKRQVYPLMKNCKPRTDRSFRLLEDPHNHHKDSPLLELYPAIDMVYQVLSEFMHGQCIGNMKKLLCDYWTNPSLRYLTKAQIMQVSSRLTLLQFCIPAGFQRCTRSLDVLSKWKATEYRLFLLYVGSIVLKGILPEHLYNHFMLFSVGCRVLCSPNSC
ncbi:hypothetical protein QAD02_021254 [Eretmocerus hayati]|uniref:Uncharacterized protein n=1 Tax=Eretmocerus hayati TaxID=131215 RepID=A0ACC2PPP0_9HYME|nr:hypothetical protein QAD02_021254 [Eretmocerus hayati]